MGGAEGAAVVGGVSVLGAALVSLGVSKDSVIKYESSLRADRFLLIVHASSDEEVAGARKVIDSTETIDTIACTAQVLFPAITLRWARGSSGPGPRNVPLATPRSHDCPPWDGR